MVTQSKKKKNFVGLCTLAQFHDIIIMQTEGDDMVTLGDVLSAGENWKPTDVDLQLVADILKEVATRHDVEDAGIADSLSKRLLIVADHLATDITKLKIYYTVTRSRAKDRLNDVKQSAIDEKSDAGKERVALGDLKFRELRDEYKKAELLATHLEIKYKQLISHHYSFKDTARRLANLKFANTSGSDSEKSEDFNMGGGGHAAATDEADKF